MQYTWHREEKRGQVCSLPCVHRGQEEEIGQEKSQLSVQGQLLKHREASQMLLHLKSG